MSYLYQILAVVGWVWAGIVGVFLLYRRQSRQPRGFDVLQNHEKQS